MYSPRPPGGRARAAACVVALVAEMSGCGAGSSAFCPNDVPSACSAPAPSYAADVAPLLTVRCRGCHTAGGMSFNHPFDSYAQVQMERMGILAQVHKCLMPPADQPQPSAEERQIIFTWLVCGAPEN